jgi:hypothetical protein
LCSDLSDEREVDCTLDLSLRKVAFEGASIEAADAPEEVEFPRDGADTDVELVTRAAIDRATFARIAGAA